MPRNSVLLFLLTFTAACNTMTDQRQPPEVHGHRGCRGLRPENSISGFKKALDLGCDWLEMDVVISGDGQVVVSHEPWMSGHICRTPEGDSITPAMEPTLNLYRMSVKEIQRYDCGSKGDPDHPDQVARKAVKPTLREVVEFADDHAAMTGLRMPDFNIEIKSRPEWYGMYQPAPDKLAEIVLSTLDSLGISDRCVVQCFDPAVLEAVHRMEEYITTALLVENEDGLEANLARLSFRPDIYSPYHRLVDSALVQALKERDIRLLVWTVNEEADIQRMIELGVDGIISDRPDRVIRLIEDLQ